MTPAQKVKNAEVAWSHAISVGCSPLRSMEGRQTIKTFLEKTLADDYTNIDHFGKVRSKKQDLGNCVKGRYVVKNLTLPKMKIRTYGDSCAVIVGRDKVRATFKGLDVSGKFIWTDTWVRFGNEWKCVASHGSKL